MTNNDQYAALAQDALDIVGSLFDVMPDLMVGGEQTQQALTQYAAQIEILSQRAEHLDLSGVQAVTMIVYEGIQQFSMLQRALTESEYNLLELWPTLLISYIENPMDIDMVSGLLEFLQQPEWVKPLPADEADMLLTLLLVEETTEANASEIPEPESEPTIEDVNKDGHDTSLADNALNMMGDLFEVIPDMISGGDQTQQALQAYSTHIQNLAELAENANLPGIQAISMMVDEGVQKFASLNRALETSEQALLERWPTLVISYFENPQDIDVVSSLLDFLQQPEWVKPLPADEAEMLLTLLLPEEETQTAPVAEANDAEFMMDELLLVLPLVDVPEKNEANEEMVSMLRMEADSLLDIWDELLAQAAATENFDTALETYAEQLERLASAAEVVSLTGLQHFFAYLHALVTGFRMLGRGLNEQEQAVLASWPNRFGEHLDNLSDTQKAQALIAVLQDPIWFASIDDSIANSLLELLTSISLTQELIDEDAEPRQVTATVDDVSLALPEDVNPELLEGLLVELPTQTAEFSEAIQRLVAGQGGQADVEVSQRIAHTLKGAANTVGITGIANLTHHVEDILLAFTKHNALPAGNLANTLVNVSDMLEGMSESLLGIGEPPAQADRIAALQEVLDWANQIDKDGIPDAAAQVASSVSPEAKIEGATPEKTPATVEQTVPTLRVEAPIIDNLLRLSGESMILNGQLQEKLTDIISQTRSAQQQNKVLLQLSSELEHLIDVQDVFNVQDSSHDDDFDPLEFDHYNEVHTFVRRLIEAATDAQTLSQVTDNELINLESMMVNQSRLNRENQDSVLRTRMVPVHTIVPRLQRGVRQTCRLTEKQVNLTIAGESTLIDSDILSALVDPLMHILRNAIDHGIESDEHRQLLGKPADGSIHLSFSLEGDHIAVRCQDDGGGIDSAGIRYKAIELGLINADDKMSVEELQRLIFMPGFSIKDSASQTSGRGVGMDAVYSKIQSLKGSVEISSTVDVGTSIGLFLPLTLLSAHALLIRSHRQVFAIVNRGIEQIHYSGNGQLKKAADKWEYHLDNEVYDTKPFEVLINVPMRERRSLERLTRPLLLVRGEGSSSMVSVEEVIDSRDIVVKPMGAYLPDIRGIMGATILGDGSVAPVLDLPELLRAPRETEISQAMGAIHQDSLAERDIPCALVVDDSLSARRSLELFVQDMGFDCRAARDGLEAIEVIGTKRPDIILVDLEMPRMNGLELTSHVRSQDSTKEIPVIMITSRSTEKHRQQAQSVGVNLYLTKPFSEDELISHIQELLNVTA